MDTAVGVTTTGVSDVYADCGHPRQDESFERGNPTASITSPGAKARGLAALHLQGSSHRIL
ncbi:hypothetical protein Cflav_PD5698 [Pedosphaera parvula Ellin514]|uniref:Uncharacterized protein n=1 Tax=Pedosphaera parvula (strain Ellin514) TaxID=320771 RepID=B9XAM8_PEDPL|nr:hypothetical protein Cflav_PD5698 [Pedosphaera parvula Ellin514]